MTRSLLAASIFVAAASVSMAASASEFDYRGKRVVSDTIAIDDLDLSTGDGMDRLIRRVRGRIDDMCGWDEDCRDEAWLSADWQVARAAERDQWRSRVTYERQVDRRDYREGGPGRTTFILRRTRGGGGGFDGGPPPAPQVVYAPPPPTARPITKTTTVTTQTFTVRTTVVTLSYRVPPAGPWRPSCTCNR